MGATVRPAGFPYVAEVSIHAPVWVRPGVAQQGAQPDGFQFTHPCGCDWKIPAAHRKIHCFNSRTRVGATSPRSSVNYFFVVSIHAPVWVRHALIVSIHAFEAFQFTHPCGCDFHGLHSDAQGRGFNSRTRVGATRDCHNCAYKNIVSIHAPVWVRHQTYSPLSIDERFQFTHPCGCDASDWTVGTCGASFNSRTRVGATSRRRSIPTGK